MAEVVFNWGGGGGPWRCSSQVGNEVPKLLGKRTIADKERIRSWIAKEASCEEVKQGYIRRFSSSSDAWTQF